MSDTPRTNAAQFDGHNFNIWPRSYPEPDKPPVYVVYADFARQLERELAEAQGRVAKLEGMLMVSVDYKMHKHTVHFKVVGQNGETCYEGYPSDVIVTFDRGDA